MKGLGAIVWASLLPATMTTPATHFPPSALCNNASNLCVSCKEPENEKCKWLQCLKCNVHGHSSCVRMAGVKSPASEINWVCDVCADEIRSQSNVYAEIQMLKKDMEEIKKLLQKPVTNMEETVSAAVHNAVTAVSSEMVAEGEEGSDSPLSWVEAVSKGRRKKIKKQQKKLLIIKSNDDESVIDRKDEVGQALDEVQILDSKFTKAGKIVINFETDEARKKAEDRLQELEGVTVTHRQKMQPKIILCNVGKEEKRETLIEQLIERNNFLTSIMDIKDKMKVIFDKPASGKTTHYIIKCDPEVRRLIHNNGDKLNLKWGRHSVYDRYYALMCFYCLKYGHKKDKCPAKINNERPKCFKCAEAHEGHSCQAIERKCGNCRTVKRYDDHSVSSTACPILAAELMRIRENTDHGYE